MGRPGTRWQSEHRSSRCSTKRKSKGLPLESLAGPEGRRFLQEINLLAAGSPPRFPRMFSYGLANLLIKIRTDLRLKTRAVNKLAGDIFVATQHLVMAKPLLRCRIRGRLRTVRFLAGTCGKLPSSSRPVAIFLASLRRPETHDSNGTGVSAWSSCTINFLPAEICAVASDQLFRLKVVSRHSA